MKTSAKQLARGLYQEIQERGVDQLDAVTEAFVRYLAETHQVSLWREVVQALDHIWKEEHGVANIHVTAAHKPSTALLKALQEKFQGASITTDIDESVLGGAAVRIDDRIVDGTLSGRLQSLKQQLAN